MDAAADPVKHSTLGEVIEQVHLLDEMHRMVQRHDHDRHAEPSLLQLRCDIGSDLERRATARRIAVEMMFGEKDALEAHRIRGERLFDDGVDDVLVLRRVPRAGEVDDREFHYSSNATAENGIGVL